jgi:hypothetical protein
MRGMAFPISDHGILILILDPDVDALAVLRTEQVFECKFDCRDVRH